MSYEDPVKRREKGDGGLRVVLTPLTGPVYETSLHRLQRRNAEKVKSTNAEKVQEAKRRRLERVKEWKKANAEKVKEQKKKDGVSETGRNCGNKRIDGGKRTQRK